VHTHFLLLLICSLLGLASINIFILNFESEFSDVGKKINYVQSICVVSVHSGRNIDVLDIFQRKKTLRSFSSECSG
jgi:hypothetical protein